LREILGFPEMDIRQKLIERWAGDWPLFRVFGGAVQGAASIPALPGSGKQTGGTVIRAVDLEVLRAPRQP
jgi:hypothetical protein